MASTPLGWPVLDGDVGVGPFPRLRRFNIPSVDREFTIRDGAAGFILAHLALWFDEEVERLDLGVWDEWGYAKRQVTQGSTWSEHAGGTAIDVNATRHPFNVPTSRTFTAAQIKKIHRRLRFYRGVVRWGGDYRRPDAMHFEISGSLKQAEALAKVLLLTPRGRRISKANPGLRKVIFS